MGVPLVQWTWIFSTCVFLAKLLRSQLQHNLLTSEWILCVQFRFCFSGYVEDNNNAKDERKTNTHNTHPLCWNYWWIWKSVWCNRGWGREKWVQHKFNIKQMDLFQISCRCFFLIMTQINRYYHFDTRDQINQLNWIIVGARFRVFFFHSYNLN